MSLQRQSLEGSIETIRQQIAALGADLQPGVLTRQYNVCGTAGCRCKADPPEKHGPYYQLSFTRKGKSTTHFVKKEDLPLVRRQVLNYRRLKRLLDRWISLGMELSVLRLQQERQSRADSLPKKRPKLRVSKENHA